MLLESAVEQLAEGLDRRRLELAELFDGALQQHVARDQALVGLDLDLGVAGVEVGADLAGAGEVVGRRVEGLVAPHQLQRRGPAEHLGHNLGPAGADLAGEQG